LRERRRLGRLLAGGFRGGALRLLLRFGSSGLRLARGRCTPGGGRFLFLTFLTFLAFPGFLGADPGLLLGRLLFRGALLLAHDSEEILVLLASLELLLQLVAGAH